MCVLLCIRVYLWVARDTYVVMCACVCHFFRWPLKILTLFGRRELNYDGNTNHRQVDQNEGEITRKTLRNCSIFQLFYQTIYFIMIFSQFFSNSLRFFDFLTIFFSNFLRLLYDFFFEWFTPSDQNGSLHFLSEWFSLFFWFFEQVIFRFTEYFFSLHLTIMEIGW